MYTQPPLLWRGRGRSKQNGTRKRARIELTGRKTEEVLAEIDKFSANLNPKNPADFQPLLECLWVYQMQRVPNKDLLQKVLEIQDAKTRAAAVRVLGNWNTKIENGLVLLKKYATDAEPLVRSQAILAASNFEAVVVVNRTLKTAEFQSATTARGQGRCDGTVP